MKVEVTGVLSLPGDRLDAPPVSFTVEGLFDDYGALVGRWAVRLGGRELEAEDVVQEVFLVVGQRLPSYRPDCRVTTWLYQITQNVVHQQRWRLRWRRLWSFGLAGAAEVASPEPLPVEHVERRESRERIHRILDQMSERSRTVLVLFEWEQLTGEEIAERLDAKVATVWVWLHRARAEFIRRMKALDAEGSVR